MTTTAPMTMADAEQRLVEVHGFDRSRAREVLRDMHNHAATRANRKAGSSYDEDTFTIDYSLTGGRYGRGRFTFMED